MPLKIIFHENFDYSIAIQEVLHPTPRVRFPMLFIIVMTVDSKEEILVSTSLVIVLKKETEHIPKSNLVASSINADNPTIRAFIMNPKVITAFHNINLFYLHLAIVSRRSITHFVIVIIIIIHIIGNYLLTSFRFAD